MTADTGQHLPAREELHGHDPLPADQQPALVESSLWSAPLPHPDDLAAFDAVVPGAAEAILDGFNEEGKHRRRIEDRDSRSGAFERRISGVVYPALHVAVIASGIYFLATGVLPAGFGLLGFQTFLIVLGKIMGYLTHRGSKELPSVGTVNVRDVQINQQVDRSS